MYTQRGAAYGSVRNLVKSSKMLKSKVRQFLLSKPSYAKCTFATRKFQIMKAFASFKNGIWCIDLAYVDELDRDNDGVQNLLVQDISIRTVDAKGKKKKIRKKRFVHF